MDPHRHRTGSHAINTVRTRLAALGGAALLTAAAVGCQAAQSAGADQAGQAGQPAAGEVTGAVEQLLSWEALTVQATLDASADELYARLRQAERPGGPRASRDDARALSELELTAVVGDPGTDTDLVDLGADAPLDTALSLGFGGEDALGVKRVQGRMFTRVNAQTIVRDVYAAGDAAAARAARFTEDAAQLPEPVRVAGDALRGGWVEAEPHLYEAYAEALDDSGIAPSGTVAGLTAALSDAQRLLDGNTQWAFARELTDALGSGATVRAAGEEHGARLYRLELGAADARRALGPLLELLAWQQARFGLPPLAGGTGGPGDGGSAASGAAGEPGTGGAGNERVTAELSVRNGQLTHVTFDLAQLGSSADAGAGAGTDAADARLPLRLALAGGTALSLEPPPVRGRLTPQDLTVALMYLRVRQEEREEEAGRPNIPGPIQP